MSAAVPSDFSSAELFPNEGIVEVCEGITVDLSDEDGVPLPLDLQQRMIDVLELDCTEGPSAQDFGALAQDYAYAHLNIKPGWITYTTTANGMPYGPYKTLDCMIRFGSGPYQACGSADGHGTSLSTRSNGFCPVPGQAVNLKAHLHMNGVTYVDDAFGVTQ